MESSDLIKWRSEHGYTQKELAIKLGVQTITVYRWEKAMREIPSFLHLALECMGKKGGGKETIKGTKKKKERR